MTKAISFDLWNTLIVSNPTFKTARLTLYSDFLGVSDTALAPVLLYLDKELDKKAEKTGLQTNFEERIQLLVQKMNLSLALPAGKLQELYALQEQLFLTCLPYPSEQQVGKLLNQLKQTGMLLFLVSNTGFIVGKTLRLAMERLEIGTQWDKMLFSDEIGYSKPDKRIFAPLQQIEGLQSHEILHIGDNFITDYQGARKNGFSARLYTRHLPAFDANLDTIASLWDIV